MPWKIRAAKFNGKDPCLHMADEAVDLHLMTDLASGVIDLYIGNINPGQANIHLMFDVESTPVVKIRRVDECDYRQVSIIDSVLKTMSVAEGTRRAILLEARQVAQRRSESDEELTDDVP